jgi:hypothetical protein
VSSTSKQRGFLGKRSDRVAKYVLIIVSCGGVPFFFVHSVWSEMLLKAYLLTTLLLFVLVSSYWKSTRELWFWRAMIPILLIHGGIVVGLARLNF